MFGARKIDFQLHPQRDLLYNELHIRPFHNLTTPQQVTHLAACAQRDELTQSFEHLSALCRRYEVNPPLPAAVAFHQDFGDFTVHWERHVEFYSLTIMQPITTIGDPFQHPAINLLPDDWLAQLPGQIVSAFHIAIDNQQLNFTMEPLSRYFEGHRVMTSSTRNGKAQLYTAFKLHGDGFGRFIIRNTELNDTQLGQLTRRLMELETYRLLALIALPIAKRIAPELGDIDKHLAQILVQVSHLDSTSGERKLLEEMTQIEAQLETYRAETNRRFSATSAYHELVKTRLVGIHEEAIDGHLSLGEFMNRRLDPALRTCESLQAWMEDLSKRIERASDLLRTRVNLNLQEQNRSQLEAMNRRSKLQFRLQETVEGLSIAAISYYMVGLLGYFFSGFPLESWGINKNLLLACSIPLVILIVWQVTRRIKRRLINSPKRELDL